MTRSEAYAEGFADGARWAQVDIHNGRRDDTELNLRDEASHQNAARSWALRTTGAAEDWLAARTLGNARGYRDTWSRWDAGTLTWEMLEHAPVAR